MRHATLLAILALLGCRESPVVGRSRDVVPLATTSLSSSASSLPPDQNRAAADALLSPLEAESWVIPLSVERFADAVVAVPIGSRERRPLIVALHGNFDRPEWACATWREVAGPKPFILCLRGKAAADSPPGDARFTYHGVAATTKELASARAALTARFGERLLDTPAVYAGFSLGASLGVAIAAGTSGLYPRLVLVEGGSGSWNALTARRFRQGGGERVMFVCAQPGCVGKARAAAKLLGKEGVLTEVVDSGDHGHRYDGPVAEATRSRWNWVREGLAGFGDPERAHD